MISIITAVYNQLGMNRLFFETLRKNTKNKFELIIVDNCSTDGSREYFRQYADVLIENDGNYSYPHCQNQGINAARYDYLVFLNNDVLVSRNWDERLIEAMRSNGLDAVCPCSNDNMETRRIQKKINTRWKYIKYPLLYLFGSGYGNLRLMKNLMYCSLDRFADKRYRDFGTQVVEGFTGPCVLLSRKVVEKVGRWDDRVQAGDFDYFCTLKKRSVREGDFKPMGVSLGTYIHHYQRLTYKAKWPPFRDRDRLVDFRDKWKGEEEQWLKDIRTNL